MRVWRYCSFCDSRSFLQEKKRKEKKRKKKRVTPVWSHVPGGQAEMKLLFDWQHFKRTHMNSHPFNVQTLIDYNSTACTLVDTGYLSYGVISEKFTRKHHLISLEITYEEDASIILGRGTPWRYTPHVHHPSWIADKAFGNPDHQRKALVPRTPLDRDNWTCDHFPLQGGPMSSKCWWLK